MLVFYRQIARSGTASGAIETDAAVEAGTTVRAELRKAGVREEAHFLRRIEPVVNRMDPPRRR